MLTGYLLFILFVTVGVTSYYRFHIPYKWFYNAHQIVFAAFFFAIIHTIDRIQRSQGGRSQVFVWVSASLVLYLSDRATLHTKGRHATSIEGYHAINSLKETGPTDKDNGVIVLKLKKPRSFHFVAGHHAKLRMKEIDPTWHPFTIASSPDSDLLEFYIKVNATGTWTYNLLDLIRQKHSAIGVSEKMTIEVMGPFGTPIPYSSNYSDALLFGSGTGFVPSLSILQQHVEKCLKLDPSSYKLQKEKKHERLENLHDPESRPEPEKLQGSVRIASSQEREKQANAAKRKIYEHLASFVGYVTGLIALSLTISWNNLPYEVSSSMTYVLIFATACFEVLYLILTVTKQEIPSMEFFVDFFVFVAALIGDWYWMAYEGMNTLTSTTQVLYSVLMIYILSRFWKEICVEIRKNPMLETSKDRIDFNIYDSVTFIWIERSADIVQNILPLFCDLWEKLEMAWGNELANETFKFQIYCTDQNKTLCEKLLELAQNSSLSSMDGNIFVFKRPSFPAVLERHSLALNSTRDISSTIIAFCGSSMVGGMIKDAYVMNEIWKASIGLLGHHAELQVHSYGGLFAKKKAKHVRKQNETSETISVPSNLYWESSFAQKSRDQLPHPTCSLDGNMRKGTSNRKIHTPTLDAMRSRKRDMEQKYGSETDSTMSKDNKRSALLLFSGREGSKDTMETKQETAIAAEVNDILASPLAEQYNIGEQVSKYVS